MDAPPEQACFSRHSSLGRDGAFTPRKTTGANRSGSEVSGRAIKSLFGSKPKTLREDPVSPAERMRVSRTLSKMTSCGTAENEQTGTAVRFPIAPISSASGGIFSENLADRRYPVSANASSPEYTSVAYLHPAYRASRGIEDVPHHFLVQNSCGDGSQGREAVREVWKEVVGDCGGDGRDRESLSNLMQGVVDKHTDRGVDGRGGDLRYDGAGERKLRPRAEHGQDHEIRDDLRHCDRQSHGVERERGMESDLSDIETNSYTMDERDAELDGRRASHESGHLYSMATSQHSKSTGWYSAAAVQSRRKDQTRGGRASKDQGPPEALALAMHKLHRLHVENTALKKEVQSTRENRETAAEDKGQFEAIQTLLRTQLEEKEQVITELQNSVSELRSHLRLVQRESESWQARATSLSEEKEKMVAGMEDSQHPILEHMDQVVGKLRQDCNAKVEELLQVQNQMMQQQIELRHRDERIKQQEGEIEALNRTISSLRDYVVDSGQFLTHDPPLM